MTRTPDPDPDLPAAPRRPRRAPAPLVVAASLVAIEATLLVMVGLAEIVVIAGDRLVMGVSTSLFFLVYGAGLGFCAWAVTRLHSWARSPIVLAQMIQMGVAWSFRDAPWTWVSLSLAGVALVVVAGLFHPAALDALSDDG